MVNNQQGGLGVLGLLSACGVAAVLAALGPATTTAASSLTTSVPEVIGPIAPTAAPGDTSHNYVFYSTPMNLAKVGYEEQEYFIRGVATRYATANPSASM